MAMSNKLSGRGGAGGGYGSNKVVNKNAPKQEPVARKVNPAAAGQLGVSLGNHAMMPGGKVLPGAGQPVYGGPGYEAKGPTKGVVGVGGGRTIHKSGSQSTHGDKVARQAPAVVGHGRSLSEHGRTTK